MALKTQAETLPSVFNIKDEFGGIEDSILVLKLTKPTPNNDAQSPRAELRFNKNSVITHIDQVSVSVLDGRAAPELRLIKGGSGTAHPLAPATMSPARAELRKQLAETEILFKQDRDSRKKTIQNYPYLKGHYTEEFKEVMRLARILVARMEKKRGADLFRFISPNFLGHTNEKAWQSGWQIKFGIDSDRDRPERTIRIKHHGADVSYAAVSTGSFVLDEAGRRTSY